MKKVEGFPNQTIEKLYVVTAQGASSYKVGREGITGIYVQPLLLGDPHYVIFKGDEVLATVNCNAPCELIFRTTKPEK